MTSSSRQEIERTKRFYAGSELAVLAFARNYYQWILEEFGPALHGSCLEVGAGKGTVSKLLLKGNVANLVCIEPAPNLYLPLYRELQAIIPLSHEGPENGASPKSITILSETLEEYALGRPESFDSILCINTLEHIENEEAAVAAMNHLLYPGGSLCLLVPALPWLFGTLDESFGHYRRYRKAGLVKLVEKAGFWIRKVKFFNLLGVLTWLIMGKLLRRKCWGVYPVLVNDRLFVPVQRFLEMILPPPLGQSLLLVGQKSGPENLCARG